MVTDEQRKNVWLKQTPEARVNLITGIIEVLIMSEDISLEQSIQRVMDTFCCAHSEVMNALMIKAKEQNEGV